MALLARLRRIEAGIEWLGTDGMRRVVRSHFRFLETKGHIEAHLAREPGNVWARALAPAFGVELPPLPKPPTPTPVVKPPPAPPPALPPEPPRQQALPPAPVVVAPSPPPKPPPKPEPPPETHDIPEHMQIRPVTWRQRGPRDVDDWEDGGHDYSQCLTDYDPLADEDS